MAKIVQLPNGEEAEFPDEMDDAAISEVLQRQFGAPEAKPKTLTVVVGGKEYQVPESESWVQEMRGTAAAAEPALTMLGTGALGGLAAGSGLVARGARAAVSPEGLAAVQGGATLLKTGDPMKAATAATAGYIEGKIGDKVIGKIARAAYPAEKAVARTVSRADIAKMQHAAKRAAKLAEETPIKHMAGAQAAPEVMEEAGDRVFKRIESLITGPAKKGEESILYYLKKDFGIPAGQGREMIKLVRQQLAARP